MQIHFNEKKCKTGVIEPTFAKVELNGYESDTQGFKIKMNELHVGVLTTEHAAIIVYRNECDKWVLSPVALSKIPIITTTKLLSNGAISETTIRMQCALKLSEPVFLELEESYYVFIHEHETWLETLQKTRQHFCKVIF
jgi:hypothetical protein